MTTQSRPAPYRVSVVFSQKKGLVLLDQIRTIDKTRLVKKLGAVPANTLSVTLRTLQEVFAA
jgi:mRNA interferase MazF